MPSKVCSVCSIEKPLDGFHKRKASKDGHRDQCKKCHIAQVGEYNRRNAEKKAAYDVRRRERCRERLRALRKVWESKNVEYLRDSKRAWYAANRDRSIAKSRLWAAQNRYLARARTRAWAASNPERKKLSDRRWAENNPDKVLANINKRRAIKMTAMPAWADDRMIKEVYRLAKERTKQTGIKHHVDHVIPLNSPLVCGLHNEFNLAIVSAKENLKKGNRFWPDMP